MYSLKQNKKKILKIPSKVVVFWNKNNVFLYFCERKCERKTHSIFYFERKCKWHNILINKQLFNVAGIYWIIVYAIFLYKYNNTIIFDYNSNYGHDLLLVIIIKCTLKNNVGIIWWK